MNKSSASGENDSRDTLTSSRFTDLHRTCFNSILTVIRSDYRTVAFIIISISKLVICTSTSNPRRLSVLFEPFHGYDCLSNSRRAGSMLGVFYQSHFASSWSTAKVRSIEINKIDVCHSLVAWQWMLKRIDRIDRWINEPPWPQSADALNRCYSYSVSVEILLIRCDPHLGCPLSLAAGNRV